MHSQKTSLQSTHKKTTWKKTTTTPPKTKSTKPGNKAVENWLLMITGLPNVVIVTEIMILGLLLVLKKETNNMEQYWVQIVAIILAAGILGGLIVKLTPTKTDDVWWQKYIVPILNFLKKKK